MSREEVKTAIVEFLTNAPDQGLLEVLTYLKTLEEKKQRAKSNNLIKILQEDAELLNRVAQW
ncbi:MAG: hypothetical protein ACJA2S_005582 [Cyclobacteriaceae bacterium]